MRAHRVLAAATVTNTQQRPSCACKGVFTIQQHQVRQVLMIKELYGNPGSLGFRCGDGRRALGEQQVLRDRTCCGSQ